MTYYEKALKLRPFIEKAAQFLSDEDALQAKTMYPKWSPGVLYKADFKFLYNEALYRVLQEHTSQETWSPDIGTETLYARIDETHSGEMSDPIPYDGNMTLETGKYYSQDGVIYLCTRDTGIPVYNTLNDLVGIYVALVNNN